ncbi:MAG: hypothetical protein ABIR98_06460 [Usitatibacter sp.]
MLFALDRDDGLVAAFASEADAAAHCKGVDVRDGFWLFYADDGSPLEARFLHPDRPGDPEPASHDFSLQRAMSGRWLQEQVPQMRSVRGCGLSSVAELVEMLKINRGKRIPGARRA